MKIEPKVRGFICTTAHPAGCRANVLRQVEYARAHPVSGPKRVLIIGASMGYGLASRVCSAFSCGAATVGVIFDKPAIGGRTASAGWYNTAAFEEMANDAGLFAATVNGDAFSAEIKERTISAVLSGMGQADLVIYSLAAPRRTMADGTAYSSVLKTIGEAYTNKTVDLKSGEVREITIPPASEEEIAATIKVMGGEDWQDWIAALHSAGALAPEATTLAYSYIGPELTHPMYLAGSIGRAKDDLSKTAAAMNGKYGGLRAYISVNKALVTQSSSAIPVVPLYIALLYKVMKERGLHEGCCEQISRLYSEKLFSPAIQLDDCGRLRPDDLEMYPEIQEAVLGLWDRVNTENISELADIAGYWSDFYNLFGFSVPGVDYEADCDCEVPIKSLCSDAAGG